MYWLSIDHHGKIQCMNTMLVRSESAIMACNTVAVLPVMRDDVTRLITMLLLCALQTLIQFHDIDPSNHTKHHEIRQQTAYIDVSSFTILEKKEFFFLDHVTVKIS